jgi:hypothetical protein
MIKYQIISSTGIDVREKENEAALADIREYTQRHHPWLYLDGQPANPVEVTIDALQNAQMIVLTHTILGG